MKQTFTLIFSLFVVAGLQAQERYIDPQFGVERVGDLTYGTNITILRGLANAAPEDLKMDIYRPAGDTATNRPVVLIAPTGSFLPILFNMTTTGSRFDSTAIETAVRLVSRGYVVGVFDYRKGWDPGSEFEDVRKGTLLQAAYRGIQDTRTAVRYMRSTVAEEGNPHGINPDKIGIWGIGTGGYLALGAASLDDISEVQLDKFLADDGSPLIVESVSGDIDGKLETFFDPGTNTMPSNLPNHVDYDSDIIFSFNQGGALGDSSWIDGAPNEPAYVGVHCTQDIFAPFFNGIVIVPTTREEVVRVAGTRLAIERANDLGLNDGIAGLGADDDPLSELIEEQKEDSITAQLLTEATPLLEGTDNFYAFDIPVFLDPEGNPRAEGSPWDWWGLQDLRNLVAAVNAATGASLDADLLHLSGLATNPDMSAEKARTYIDTIFQLAIPRMYLAYELGDAIVGTTDIVEASAIGLSAFPNPTTEILTIKTTGATIEAINVLTQGGLLLSRINDINSQQYEWQRPATIPSGPVFLQIQTDEGTTVQKIILQ